MPELPEVENLARGLRPRLIGATIQDAVCHFPPVLLPNSECFADIVRGRSFEQIRRHGKYLFFLLSGRTVMALHLRMTGQFLFVGCEQPPDKHTHLELILAEGQYKVIFRDVRKFGRLKLLEGSIERFLREKRLGTDALLISTEELYKRFQETSRGIKATLLDQTKIAGLGNIYTDEILFRESLSPLRKARSLSTEAVASLRRSLHSVLRSAIRRKGTTISDYVDSTGRRGSYQDSLLVYARAGKPCRRCGTTLMRSLVAGRGTYTCPSCQRL